MSTQLERIVAAMTAQLGAAGVRGVRRFRGAAGEPPAVVVQPLGDSATNQVGGEREAQLAVAVIVIAQATNAAPADKVADETLADVHRALMSDMRFGLGAVMFSTLESISWDYDDVESVAVRLVYQVTYRASAYDLEVAG